MKTFKDYLAENTTETYTEIIEFLATRGTEIEEVLSRELAVSVKFDDVKENINTYGTPQNNVAFVSTNIADQINIKIWTDVKVYCKVVAMDINEEWVLQCFLLPSKRGGYNEIGLFSLLIPEEGEIRIVNDTRN